jgi:hypothetical protein
MDFAVGEATKAGSGVKRSSCTLTILATGRTSITGNRGVRLGRTTRARVRERAWFRYLFPADSRAPPIGVLALVFTGIGKERLPFIGAKVPQLLG